MCNKNKGYKQGTVVKIWQVKIPQKWKAFFRNEVSMACAVKEVKETESERLVNKVAMVNADKENICS